jgi:predicted nucleotidyltransferase
VKDEKLMEFYDEETRKVVEILKRANPEKIIRFGSSVWGTLTEDSDIDLCVLKHLEDSSVREKQRLRRLLSQYEYAYPVDIELHVYSSEEYEERLRRGNLFLKEIERGEVVYARR